MSPVSKKDNLRQFFYADHDLRVRDVGAAVANISGDEEPVDKAGHDDADKKEEKKAPPVSPRSNKLTQFDREFIAKWKEHKEMGHFRYTLESVKCKVLDGDFGFVAQLNPNRASNRRAPQAMLHLEQPFSHDKFNFTKVDLEKEGVFELKHMQDHSQDRNIVVINVSPLEFGASLLLPSMDSCLPQVLTANAVRVAMDAVLLSGVRNMKAAFNSLCAFASVNHLHWHLYYLQKHSLKLETLPVHRLAGDCYEVRKEEYPAVGYAFQVKEARDLDRVAENVHRLTSFLTKEDIGHNVFITRGSSFDNSSPGKIDCLRVFVWAREKIVGAKDAGAFLVAVCELSGQILCYDAARYETLQEQEVTDAIRHSCQGVKDRVDDRVRALFKSGPQRRST